jgi:hypothetical protein
MSRILMSSPARLLCLNINVSNLNGRNGWHTGVDTASRPVPGRKQRKTLPWKRYPRGLKMALCGVREQKNLTRQLRQHHVAAHQHGSQSHPKQVLLMWTAQILAAALPASDGWQRHGLFYKSSSVAASKCVQTSLSLHTIPVRSHQTSGSDIPPTGSPRPCQPILLQPPLQATAQSSSTRTKHPIIRHHNATGDFSFRHTPNHQAVGSQVSDRLRMWLVLLFIQRLWAFPALQTLLWAEVVDGPGLLHSPRTKVRRRRLVDRWPLRRMQGC